MTEKECWSDKFSKIWRRTRYRRPILILIGSLAWCCIVIPALLVYMAERGRADSLLSYSTNGEINDKVKIDMNLLTMDPNSRTSSILVQIDPLGKYSAEDGTLASNLTLNLRYLQATFSKGSVIEPFTMSIPFTVGTLRDYPMDDYLADFPIAITTKSEDNSCINIPFDLTLDGISQLFIMRFKIVAASQVYDPTIYKRFSQGGNSYVVAMNLTRPLTTKLICAFIALLMWTLAIALANVAWDSIVYKRDIHPSLLSIGVAMLFALPALRNSQPGIPAMGCSLDMTSFFWSLVLIAISSSALIFKWVLSWKPAFWHVSEA